MSKSIYTFSDKGDLSGITTYQAGALQSAVHRSLQKYSDKALQRFGITKMQWMIIGVVLDAGIKGARITELAEVLGTTLPYLTTTINLLESKGMLQRVVNTNDNRSKLVIINPTFVPTCAEIETALRDELRKSIYSQVDPKDFYIYVKVLHQLSKV